MILNIKFRILDNPTKLLTLKKNKMKFTIKKVFGSFKKTKHIRDLSKMTQNCKTLY